MEGMTLQLLEQMREMTEQLKEAIEQLQRQSEQLQQQDKQLTAMREEISRKDAQIAALTAKIEELTHKKNSRNSSVPPSNDRLNKPAPKSLREKSGRKAGGQAGHKGSGMKIDREPDEIIRYYPDQCRECPHTAECTMRRCGTRYEYEVVVDTKLIAHQVFSCKSCLLTGEEVRGAYPSHITGAKQYGAGVKALATTLLSAGYMSVDRVQKFLESLRIPISSGKIQSLIKEGAALLAEPVKQIAHRIEEMDVAHFDETGWRVEGKLYWLHCACNSLWRFYSVQSKRGQEGMEQMGILPNFHGVAVHDFWKPYRGYDNVLHAMCCAHLERELVYAHESGNQVWAKKLQTLLKTMCHRRKVLQKEGRNSFPESELAGYLKQYDALVSEGIEANPIPERTPGKRGRCPKGKFRSLLDRFHEFKDDILRFARDWSVPYTNNTAEQAIRFARVKEKVSGCFRTKSGADNFACIISFTSTAALHGVSSFDALCDAFNNLALPLVLGWTE